MVNHFQFQFQLISIFKNTHLKIKTMFQQFEITVVNVELGKLINKHVEKK
jgi:hypothetical protein